MIFFLSIYRSLKRRRFKTGIRSIVLRDGDPPNNGMAYGICGLNRQFINENNVVDHIELIVMSYDSIVNIINGLNVEPYLFYSIS